MCLWKLQLAKLGAFFLRHSVVFLCQTRWQYSDVDPLTGAPNACGYEKITIFEQISSGTFFMAQGVRLL